MESIGSQTILIHGSAVNDNREQLPNDIDVVSLNPLEDEDYKAIRLWAVKHDLPEDLPIDAALSIGRDQGLLTVPTPNGIVPRYELIGSGDVQVQVIAVEGLSAALRAAVMGRREVAKGLMIASTALSLTTKTHPEAAVEGWDKYTIGLTGIRNAFNKDPKSAKSILSEHPFGNVLLALIDQDPQIATYPSMPTYALGEELTFFTDGNKPFARIGNRIFDNPDELLTYLFNPPQKSEGKPVERPAKNIKMGRFLSRLFDRNNAT